ncbi:AAA family ATPase [Kitasatospora fiedleri]|uniref:AAA family ATPase n=1 Tax=Kitasatospora fiedleri TaxID=2991545 RepID=UPI00249A70E2|nr:AAA family ATPase [Kitasatospora fiedleri]
MRSDHRPWDVLLIGGASGVGKSRAAARLADSCGAFTVELDDVVAALQAATTPATHPALHHFAGFRDPERELGAERVLERQIATAQAVDEAVLGVVRNRLSVPVPAVVEGDYLTPAAAVRAAAEAAEQGRRLHAVFLHEGDPARIGANYAHREPECGPQPARAAISARYSHWLAAQARAHGLPVVDCRPYDTLPQRLAAALA